MIRINALDLPLDEEIECRGGIVQTGGALVRRVARAWNLPTQQVRSVEVLRRSIDARRKSNAQSPIPNPQSPTPNPQSPNIWKALIKIK